MKKMFWWLLPVSFVVSACPFESNVALAPGPSEPVDSTLFGYWYGIIKDFSDVYGIEALEVTKQSDSVYAITRYGKAMKGDMILPDTAYYTGFISYLGEKRFMNIEGTTTVVVYKKNKREYKSQKVYYLSVFETRNDTMHVKTITDDFSTRKIFKNSDDLSQLVSASLSQQKNIYDELYALSYRKIQKPQPLKPL